MLNNFDRPRVVKIGQICSNQGEKFLADGSLGGDWVGPGVDLVVLDAHKSLVDEAKISGRTVLTFDKLLAYKWGGEGVVLVES